MCPHDLFSQAGSYIENISFNSLCNYIKHNTIIAWLLFYNTCVFGYWVCSDYNFNTSVTTLLNQLSFPLYLASIRKGREIHLHFIDSHSGIILFLIPKLFYYIKINLGCDLVDKVPHQQLLLKLSTYGMQGKVYNWIKIG